MISPVASARDDETPAAAGSRAPRRAARAGPIARRRSRPSSRERLVPLRAPGEVVELVRVGIEVVQQVGVARAADQLVRAVPHHHLRRDDALGQVLARARARRRARARPRAGPAQARAVERGGRAAVGPAAGELDERRPDIEQRDGRADAPSRAMRAGLMHDQRHARRAVEERHLVPEAALAEHVAVVGGDDDDRVVARCPTSSSVASSEATCSSTRLIAAE